MKNSFSESYKAAGVDVTAGYEGVRLMKKDVERTNIPGVLTGIGGFGGSSLMFRISRSPYSFRVQTVSAQS